MIPLSINGRSVTVDADPDTPLLWVLRDHLDMTGTKVFGWYTMNNHTTKDLATLKYPSPGRGTLHDWGIEVAKANKIDLKPFHGAIVVFNTGTDAGSAGNHRVVLGYDKTSWNPSFNMHEIGHGYDLNHSWSARPDSDGARSCTAARPAGSAVSAARTRATVPWSNPSVMKSRPKPTLLNQAVLR